MMQKMKTFIELIKFEHTAFALPFAYTGLFVAAQGRPSGAAVVWVTLAMVGARTAGMTLNRLIDARIDVKNPRTKNRPILTGRFKPEWAWGCVAVSVALLILSAFMLNPLCLRLAPVALVFLTVYHYAKRWTWLCHWILGSVLAIAPMGGWLAWTGAWAWPPILLALAVAFWVAGFDILYSLQDADFDRALGLHSVPVKFGTAAALKISSACHAATLVWLALFGWAAGLGWVFAAGVVVCAVLLWTEHALVSEEDLSRINAAFFTVNGWIGVILFIFTWIDLYR